MGSSSHVGKWKRLHPKRVSSLKEKVDGPPSIYRAMRQLPKGVKLRGPYRALTFQEKEYYRKRAEESRVRNVYTWNGILFDVYYSST